MPKLLELKIIHTTVPRGKGTEEDRCRTVEQWHTTNGHFLAEYDIERPETFTQMTEYLRELSYERPYEWQGSLSFTQ